MAEQPIIIKKIKKKAAHGHHGGAWKIAYADFVTAMMAFFLLMWLLGTTDEVTKKGISEYFNNPFGVAISNAGSQAGERTSIIQAGGSDLKSQDEGQEQKGEEVPPPPENIEKLAEEQEKEKLEKMKVKIREMLDANPNLSAFKDQIKLEITPEGLKIQIIDAKNRPMFKLASSNIEDYAVTILRALAPVINELPNKVSVDGHTDALPFPDNRSGYSNWELSTDRANVARHELNLGGLAEEKVLRVVGLASSIPYNAQNPNDPMNRRISIIVMNKKTENQILHEGAAEQTASAETPAIPDIAPDLQQNVKVIASPAGH